MPIWLHLWHCKVRMGNILIQSVLWEFCVAQTMTPVEFDRLICLLIFQLTLVGMCPTTPVYMWHICCIFLIHSNQNIIHFPVQLGSGMLCTDKDGNSTIKMPYGSSRIQKYSVDFEVTFLSDLGQCSQEGNKLYNQDAKWMFKGFTRTVLPNTR